MTVNAMGIIIATSADTGASVSPVKIYRVKHFRWVGVTQNNDTCIVTDSGGNEVFRSVADGANFIDVHPLYKFMNGITFLRIDSGTLYVYLE